MAATRAPGLRGVAVRDFSGGPNLRDALNPSELAANEVIDSFNATYDERGGAGSRLGYEKRNSSVYAAALVVNVHYSTTVSSEIVQVGAKLYKGTSTTSVKTFTTAARVGFADFAGKLCVIHPVDGIFTSTDGSTYTAVADADAPKGNALEVWQNRLYVVDGSTPRLSWSDLGDPAAWTATSFNDFRSKDNEPLVALKVASGIDVLGRAGLLVFKQRSFYRVYADDGSYEVVDTSVGAASALTVVVIDGVTIFLGERGIFTWREGQVGARNVSDRFAPLWDPAEVAFDQLDLWCAGVRKGRAYFSLCRANSTANDLALEYHPQQNWIAPGDNAVSCYASYGADTEQLIGGSPTANGQVYNLYTGGTDDGAAIVSRLQTRWVEPHSGFLASFWKLTLFGRGAPGTGESMTVTVRLDYEDAGGTDFPLSMTGSGAMYDTGLSYDSGVLYAQVARQYPQHLYALGVCRQFSVLITASTTSTASGVPVLGDGAAPTQGAWALYALEALTVPLGVA